MDTNYYVERAMTREEFEARMTTYVTALGRRDRRVLFVALPVVVGASALLLFSGPRLAPGWFPSAVWVWVGVLTGVALWVGIRAWRADQARKPGVSCPACGEDLTMEADQVLDSGRCPLCGGTVITSAT